MFVRRNWQSPFLEGKFGNDLKAVRTAMAKVAKRYSPVEMADQAYPIYEKFRPAISGGVKGWGAKGILDLELIGRLKKSKPAGGDRTEATGVTRVRLSGE